MVYLKCFQCYCSMQLRKQEIDKIKNILKTTAKFYPRNIYRCRKYAAEINSVIQIHVTKCESNKTYSPSFFQQPSDWVVGCQQRRTDSDKGSGCCSHVPSIHPHLGNIKERWWLWMPSLSGDVFATWFVFCPEHKADSTGKRRWHLWEIALQVWRVLWGRRRPGGGLWKINV